MKESRKVFVIRFITFLVFSLIAPITYLIVRFDLFTITSSLQIGLWGVILFIIMVSVVVVLIKFYLDGMKTRYSLLKQIVSGFCKLILPLAIVLVLLVWMRDNINLVIESLLVIIPCEAVAIVVNPLPKRAFDNNVEGIGKFVDSVLAKREENKESK